MKTRTSTTLAALTLALSLFVIRHSSFAQGALTPPGAPAPTMKTLTQIEPRFPISSLPYTITNPGSYYVTTNLTGSGSGNGITVSSSGVTIDLNGFTLQGVSGSGSGIAVTFTYTNLMFRNGALTGWGNYGIDSYSSGFPRNILIEKITVSNNGADGIRTEAGSIVRECIAHGNAGNGINSSGGEISGCVSRNNNNSGFVASYCSLLHCSAEYNNNYGFYIYSSRALDCESLYNSFVGFDCTGSGNEIRRCRASNNNNDAIECEVSSGATVVEDCEIANNTGFGIYTLAGASGGAYFARNNISLNGSAGIAVFDNNNYIDGNHILTTSGTPCMTVGSGTNNVVVRNIMEGFAGSNISYFPNNDVGPIGSASSATSPWANISH